MDSQVWLSILILRLKASTENKQKTFSEKNPCLHENTFGELHGGLIMGIVVH
jgi:hypothetical protein